MGTRQHLITTCSADLIEDETGRLYVCEFNQGLQSGGDPALWRDQIIPGYEKMFPGAFIEDRDKWEIDPQYPHSIQLGSTAPEDKPQAIVFRLLLDAKEEFALRYAYRRQNIVIVDPLSVRAVYKDKAYAAALDGYGIFPKTLILTPEEIRAGTLRKHFEPDQKVVIKCPREEASNGTTFGLAGDLDIPLSPLNGSYFYVVQPVIRTKGYVHKRGGQDVHYNTHFRIYLTIHASKDGIDSHFYATLPRVAHFPSTSGYDEAVTTRGRVGESGWEEGETIDPILALPSSEKLSKFITTKIVPYLTDILTVSFEELTRLQLEEARQMNDGMRARALRYLRAERQYFSLDDPWARHHWVGNQFSKVALIVKHHTEEVSERLTESLMPFLPRSHQLRNQGKRLKELVDGSNNGYLKRLFKQRPKTLAAR